MALEKLLAVVRASCLVRRDREDRITRWAGGRGVFRRVAVRRLQLCSTELKFAPQLRKIDISFYKA